MSVFKEMIKPTLILAVVCFVVTGALAVVNGITGPIIDESERLAKIEALSQVLPGAGSFSEIKTAEELTGEGYSVSERIVGIYEAANGDTPAGYVAQVATKGYGGDINLFIGVNMQMETTGVVITSHNETPGLGSKAAEPSFIDQFLGAVPSGLFNVVKNPPSSDSEVEAVSGATISSRAVTNGVDDALELIKSILEEGK